MARGRSLAGVLEEVWRTSLPTVEKRRLATRALAIDMGYDTSWTEPVGASAGQPHMCDELAELLTVGGAKRVVDLQRHLVAIGERDLSRRVEKRARGRNAQAHPDPALLGEVRRAIAASPMAGKDASKGAEHKKESEAAATYEGGATQLPDEAEPEREKDTLQVKDLAEQLDCAGSGCSTSGSPGGPRGTGDQVGGSGGPDC